MFKSKELRKSVVRSAYMKVLLDQEKTGVVDIPPFIKINHIMQDLEKHNLIDKKYYQLKKWELQGCLNNLFTFKKVS